LTDPPPEGRSAAALEKVRLSVVVPVFNERFLVAESLRRLLDLELPGGGELEVLVVDDGSTDGSDEIVAEIAAAQPGRVVHLRQESNQGKGAALRRGTDAASSYLIVFHDADLEYDPRDLPRLVRPFLEDGADVVYGSRFAAAELRRVLYFRHTLGNRFITFLSNLFTDLNLSDVETCYKMFRAPLLKSIPLRSDDFGVEVEITAKIAKRNCAVFEVPISYRGRTYSEGKKIGWRDGVKALATIVRYRLIDDLYRDDEYGGAILHNLERAQNFNGWIADAIRPWIGDRVLEIGAGIGNITGQLIPRRRYVATDLNPNYLHYLRNSAVGKPYLEVAALDFEEPGAFEPFAGRFDTAVCLNVLEHVGDPIAALRNLAEVLESGGRAVIYVPQRPGLFSTLDEVLGHRCRYEAEGLRREIEAAGLEVERLEQFNRASILGWWWNGKVLRRRSFGRWQLKLFNLMVPILRLLDRFLPWKGLGLIAVARRPDGA
jgi:glycosyltransferase involved in cell wall biosynthesis